MQGLIRQSSRVVDLPRLSLHLLHRNCLRHCLLAVVLNAIQTIANCRKINQQGDAAIYQKYGSHDVICPPAARSRRIAEVRSRINGWCCEAENCKAAGLGPRVYNECRSSARNSLPLYSMECCEHLMYSTRSCLERLLRMLIVAFSHLHLHRLLPFAFSLPFSKNPAFLFSPARSVSLHSPQPSSYIQLSSLL